MFWLTQETEKEKKKGLNKINQQEDNGILCSITNQD